MKSIFTAFVLAFFVTLMCHPQNTPKWDKWQWLMGNWKGEGSGQPGQGEGYFTFSYDLDQNIIVRKNHTVLSTDKTKATVHDDLMIVYPAPDGSTKAIYFDNEGHVIDYQVSISDGSIVFTSNRTGNMPVFRLTYKPLGSNKVNIKFEMSQDGVTFNTYLEGNCIK